MTINKTKLQWINFISEYVLGIQISISILIALDKHKHRLVVQIIIIKLKFTEEYFIAKLTMA